jgi:hypothetical protein
MDLRDFHGIFHPSHVDYTFFTAAHGTFSKIDRFWATKQASTNTIKQS